MYILGNCEIISSIQIPIRYGYQLSILISYLLESLLKPFSVLISGTIIAFLLAESCFDRVEILLFWADVDVAHPASL